MKHLRMMLLLVGLCSLAACGSKEVTLEEKDVTIVLENQGGESPETIITPAVEKWRFGKNVKGNNGL